MHDKVLGVAPYVGAWIETSYGLHIYRLYKSHPMWVRGLKHLKIDHASTQLRSHPMWVRGLKPKPQINKTTQRLSHPMWVRGLKLKISEKVRNVYKVAPYVGAWIETRF